MHCSIGELFYHLLRVDGLAEGDNVASIPHQEQVEVVSLGQVANYFPGVSVVVDCPLRPPEYGQVCTSSPYSLISIFTCTYRIHSSW